MDSKLIKSINITGLFGLYNYSIPEDNDLSNAAILYGDNGVGKSTILRLVFHLLSTSNSRGHRTALYNSEFKSLNVELVSGIQLHASFIEKSGKKVLKLSISKENKTHAIWEFLPGMQQERLIFDDNTDIYLINEAKNSRRKKNYSTSKGDIAYLAALKEYVPTLFILTADRKLDSDIVSDPSDEMELRRVMRYEEPKRINELVVRSREIALSQALNAAYKWISNQVIIGANQGSMNVHSVYVDVLKHIITPNDTSRNTTQENDRISLMSRLAKIEERSNDLSKYEFSATTPTTDFKKAINVRSKKKSALAAELLNPYIKSLESRLGALDSIYCTVDKFIKTINNFLRDKQISFKLSKGFTILNTLGNTLTPNQLSSGEQQLLLLFCYVLTSRDQQSVFMIDEPEISLNIKWQRQLVKSLLDITKGSTVQYLFASHSFELIAQHSDRVIKLTSTSK